MASTNAQRRAEVAQFFTDESSVNTVEPATGNGGSILLTAAARIAPMGFRTTALRADR